MRKGKKGEGAVGRKFGMEGVNFSIFPIIYCIEMEPKLLVQMWRGKKKSKPVGLLFSFEIDPKMQYL